MKTMRKILCGYGVLLLLLSTVFLTACTGASSVVEETVSVPQKLSEWVNRNLENFHDDEWMTMQAFSAPLNGRRSVNYDLSGEIELYLDWPIISVGVQNGDRLDVTKSLKERATAQTLKHSNDISYYTYEFRFEQCDDVYIRVKVDLGMIDQDSHNEQIDQVTDALIQAFADREARAEAGTIWTGGTM